jgi:hypothetical protein
MSESLLYIFIYLLDNTEKWKKTDDFFPIRIYLRDPSPNNTSAMAREIGNLGL